MEKKSCVCFWFCVFLSNRVNQIRSLVLYFLIVNQSLLLYKRKQNWNPSGCSAYLVLSALLRYLCSDSLEGFSCKASWVVCFLYSHHSADPFCNETDNISASFGRGFLWPTVHWPYCNRSARYWLLLVWKLRSILEEYMMCSPVVLFCREVLVLCKLPSELLLLKKGRTAISIWYPSVNKHNNL